ncbi:MAG: ATP-binding protein [Gemmatimonadetes bacterium]|nr:ATP-binding protein [Gemmatimonadota bacterium]MYG22668.1 ATP-binding protein [Gemmatimonadota bacterium]MYJ39130.1 ATP-binding protein [Gemmatimonadota bacterium]
MTSEILKPWYAVATPHEDIRVGRLAEAVFAANLWAVVRGSAPEVYVDPDEFFRKTYLTTGLSTVLSRVARALRRGGETGDRIISLQTGFGGGKTHTLVALWHLARHADHLNGSLHAEDLRKAIGGRLPETVKGVAVFTNQTCDATQGRRVADGVHLHTLWGELAYQLGGKALYERVRANDESQRVPQGLFFEILQAASPCLILLDELADYCVGAAAVPVGHTSLADQTVSFVQQLTEAVQQVPGAVVVATLPASKFEVAQSEKGQEAFVTLEKRFQRLGADVKPVADEEIYDVVRSRLFDSIAPQHEPDYPETVAEVYQNMYASHSGEVPSGATKNRYRVQLMRAYPFHPLLIDALYTRWGSHPDFQRTRGVLRLLASIVGDLWNRRRGNTQTQHLIQPCHVRWSVDAVQAALTRLWGPAYQSVAAADVIGERSNSGIFDEERGGDYRREGIGEGMASAILLGSFGGQGGRSGFSSKDLKLACSRQGLNWNYADGALLELENRCFYLHMAAAGSLGKRYWFGTKPTLNKLVVQYRQQSVKENFSEEIIKNLRAESPGAAVAGATWRVVVNPAEDLPEQKAITLLILPPSLAWDENDGAKAAIQEHVTSISTRCGGKDRLYRNTLLFMVGTKRGLTRLRQAHREQSALENVRADYWDQLDEEQRRDLEKRLYDGRRAALEALGSAYTVALRVRGQVVESCSLPDARRKFHEHLAYMWKTLVEDEEWILRRVGPVTLENTGMIPKEGGLRLRDAVQAFLRFSDKPMIATREAVTAGLSQACADGLVGIGRGGSISALLSRHCKQSIPLDASEDGLWVIPPFDPEPAKAQDGEKTAGGDGASGEGTAAASTDAGTATREGSDTSTAGDTGAKGTVRRFVVRGAIPVENWGELFRCFVGPAVRMKLKRLRLGVQFEMVLLEGAALNENDAALKTMKEAARQLGLTLEIEQ